LADNGGVVHNHLLKVAMVVLLFVLLSLSVVVRANAASETRGLTVVARESATNRTGEVKLYNKSYAVIIGIDRYQNLPPDRQLAYAVKDAKGVEAAIRKNYRFDRIITLYNKEATKDRIMELLTEELPGQMGEEDALLLFWAGHGNQEKGAQGKEIGYLIPYDGSTDKIRKNLTMTELRDTISVKLPAKHVFYVMDACYSGLLTTRSVDKKSRRDLAYLKEITRENVRQVLTAGGKGEEVLDGGPKGHSVFTGRLIEILEAQGDFITANEIQAIIREKVYGDAKGRGFSQTPSFGALSGSGDFVFVPNIEQKVQDNRAEVARLEAELKQLAAREAEASRYQTEQQQREVVQQRKAAEARLKAEQLRQQQLADEARHQQEMAAERVKFETDQQQRDQDLTAAQRAEEQRLATLKAELARKKQAAPRTDTGSIDAALAEIRRLNGEIEGIESVFDRELTAGKARIAGRYDAEVAAVNQGAQQKQVPLVRDEFETEEEFKARVAKLQYSFTDRIAVLERRKQDDITTLEQRLIGEQQRQTAELRQSLKLLVDKKFTVGAESVALELGTYDPEKQLFPVMLRNTSQGVKVAVTGTIPLPRDSARAFKQQYQVGGVRPQVTVKAGNGEMVRVALVNDSDSSIYEYSDGEFITVAEKSRREVELYFTDQQTGLIWPRNGNIAGRSMNWNDAMSWVKQLNYGAYNDWRLPTKEELELFVKRGGSRPSEWLNANKFYNIQSHYYWSSSSGTDGAWDVYMSNGFVVYDVKTSYSYVWPVRAGQ
jgi:hypothetical protein